MRCPMKKQFNIIAFMVLISIAGGAGDISPQTVGELDKRAQKYYEEKEFSKAIAEWLRILEIDPDNEAIQKKIEMVYEEKHRKDISYQKAAMYLRLARKTIPTNFQLGKANTREAINNFVIAYRIDPKDADLQIMREDMKKLDEEIRIEEAKLRLSEELKKKYLFLLEQANAKMKDEKFEDALKYWTEMLGLIPVDKVAHEGKRKCELAINNRLKYERIKALLESGLALFQAKRFQDARMDYEEIVKIDPRNTEARDKLDEIDDILQEKRNYERKRLQAEQFYISGIDNINKKLFEKAQDDFENVLALIQNYKDTRERLGNIKRLKDEYEELKRIQRLQKIDREFQRGLIALVDGKYRDAVAAFETTLSLDPRNRLAGEYLLKAKDALKQKEEEEVDQNSTYYNLINSFVVSGKQLYDKGNYTESRKRWENILQLFPKNRIATEYLLRCDLQLNPKAYNEFSKRIIDEGLDLLKERKNEQALGKFELIKTISPNYPDIDKHIARARVVPERKVAGNVTPEEVEGRYRMGMEFYRKGDRESLQKALDQFRWIAARDPNYVKALINMNKIETQLRIGREADEPVLRRLTDDQQQLVRMHYFKGINYYSNNDFNKAIEEWRKVLVIDPNHDKARNNIRKCLILLER